MGHGLGAGVGVGGGVGVGVLGLANITAGGKGRMKSGMG